MNPGIILTIIWKLKAELKSHRYQSYAVNFRAQYEPALDEYPFSIEKARPHIFGILHEIWRQDILTPGWNNYHVEEPWIKMNEFISQMDIQKPAPLPPPAPFPEELKGL